ncbi:YebG family protein [Gilvimarinus sp. F26214L]|uniref:YebG family protein n=1 Tax=Gilvimarinus sp. DZF01 TaxID=3461371 RepID=UPI0040467A57
MAVVAVWKCDRDGSMFDDKKAADEHDKMLELAECITCLIEAEVPGVGDEAAENIGLVLARRKDDLAKACKGKPELLLPGDEAASTGEQEDSGSLRAVGG